MTKTNRNLKRLHFFLLGFVLLNFIIQIVTNYGLNNKLIFILKIIIYSTGIILFFINIKPIRKITFYFLYYLLTIIIAFLFWLFGGIFLAILASLVLKPIYPKENIYQNDNLKIYHNFESFFAHCCEYEIVENKLLIFEKNYGKINFEGIINPEKDEIKLINNVIEYKHKVKIYNSETQMEIETDTLEKIELKK